MSVKSKFTAIADEIRILSDSTNNMDLDNILNTLNEVNTEVNNQTNLILQITEELDYKTMDPEEKFISARNFETYENYSFQSICIGAFIYCSRLASVSFPNCISIGSYAFESCSRLTSISFPNCTTIDNNAFKNCSSLTSINFPKCTSINDYAFANCSNLTSVSFPICRSIDVSAFDSCKSLITVSFPNCISIGSNTFANCSNLTSVSFPVCMSIGSSAFQDCYRLTSVSFPGCITIGGAAFARCYSLSQVYLTGSSLCKLSNSSAFNSTPFTGYKIYFSGIPYIYVPKSLVTSYKNATNWTYFSRYISAYN